MTIFPNNYKALRKQEFSYLDYRIKPIRYEDRFLIMKWRNEQIYHLRQNELLTTDKQTKYFDFIVSKLFEEPKPEQILFSYLKGDQCIGYGGLVHINWEDSNAEISFIINTELETEEYSKHWKIYLRLIEQVSFLDLELHKIFTYAFDLRPHLYEILETNGFFKEAVLKEHFFHKGEYKDVVIHSKIRKKISFRKASQRDVEITYSWANDINTRKNSFSTKSISFDEHKRWWYAKLKDRNAIYYICEVGLQPVGIVRFDKDILNNVFLVGINLSKEYRGKGLGEIFLKITCADVLKQVHNSIIHAFIKKENIASAKSFERVGFHLIEELKIKGIETLKYELIDHGE